MSRDISTSAKAALEAGNVPMLVFVEMDFPSGFLRVNNSSINISWNDFDWLGVGRLGSIDAVKEGVTLEALGMSFSISGVPQENIAIALGQKYQGRSCKIWAAPLDSQYRVISDPILSYVGRLDVMDVELGSSATIKVSSESRLADWDRARVRRFNAEDQRITDPNDKGFEFVTQMVEKTLTWGFG